MKKLIALCAIVSVATAFAEDNVFGCLRVDSSAQETIVAVPWVAAGVAAGEIKVADIVKTANLNDGDTLKWYNNTTKAYESWELEDGKWEPVTSVITSGESSEAEDSTKQALSRGDALLLIREAPASCFYLYGQVTTAPAGEMTLGRGTATVPCYTLIAPPSVVETDLNTATWANIDAQNDYIILSDMTTLTYKADKGGWGKSVRNLETRKTEFKTDLAKIAPGIGAWYLSGKGKADGAKAVTVTWPSAN